jgi:hypothetical protein
MALFAFPLAAIIFYLRGYRSHLPLRRIMDSTFPSIIWISMAQPTLAPIPSNATGASRFHIKESRPACSRLGEIHPHAAAG